MKSKLLIVCLLHLFCASCISAQKQGKTVITVEVKEKPEMGFVISYQKQHMYSIEFDKNGFGECVIDDLKEGYLTLHNGFAEQKLLYVEPGDQIHLNFDGKSMEKTLMITGDRKPITNYLANLKLQWPEDKLYKLELSEFRDSLLALTARNTVIVESREAELQAASKMFVKIEKERIRSSVSFALLQYPMGHAWATGDKLYKPGEDYFQELRQWMKEDPELVNLYEYRILMTEGASILANQGGRYKNAYDKLLNQVEYIGKNFRNEQVRQHMINMLTCQYTEINGILKTEDLGELYKRYVQDKDLVSQYTALYQEWEKLLPGKPLPDFQAVDTTGKEYSLKDFRGRKVCLFIWQSFYPCIKEFPHLDSLQAYFQEKDIRLVCLSIDSEKQTWRNTISQPTTESATHLYLGFDRNYFNAIRYQTANMFQLLLLDEEGIIIDWKLIPPSSGKLKEYLEKKI